MVLLSIPVIRLCTCVDETLQLQRQDVIGHVLRFFAHINSINQRSILHMPLTDNVTRAMWYTLTKSIR